MQLAIGLVELPSVGEQFRRWLSAESPSGALSSRLSSKVSMLAELYQLRQSRRQFLGGSTALGTQFLRE